MEFSDTPDKKVVYYTKDGSVYVRDETNSERIGKDVHQLEFLNDDVYYTDTNSNLISYNLETREEKRLTNGAYDFHLMDGGKAIAYTDEAGVLHYLNLEENTDTVVSSNRIYIDTVVKEDETLYYVEVNDSDGISTLYRANVVESTRPEIMAEDINDFELVDDHILYKTSDLALYQLQADDIAKRIAMDVWEYDILEDQIIYLDKDDTLYTWNKEEATESIVGHNVQSYEHFSNGRIFYLTEDKELFEGSTKLANNVDTYGSFYDTLVYASDDALYMIEGSAEETVVLDEELQDYSAGYYQNQLVYQNNLDITNISGIWELTNSASDKEYFEIKPNGEFKTLVEEDSIELTEDYSHYNELILADSYNRLTFSFEGETLVLKLNESTYDLKPSSQEDANIYIEEIEQERQLAEEKREKERKEREEREEQEIAKTQAQSVVKQFITYLPEAINTGSFYYISSYIDESSDFYEEQSKFVESLYQSDIAEELEDYQISDVSVNSDGSVTVQTREVFKIYNGETESTSEYNAEYTLNKVNNNYRITSLSTDL